MEVRASITQVGRHLWLRLPVLADHLAGRHSSVVSVFQALMHRSAFSLPNLHKREQFTKPSVTVPGMTVIDCTFTFDDNMDVQTQIAKIDADLDLVAFAERGVHTG